MKDNPSTTSVGFAKPGVGKKKPCSAVYHKPATGREAVSCKDFDLDSNVDLQIELLASQSEAARLTESFSLLFSLLLFFCEASLQRFLHRTGSRHTHRQHKYTQVLQCHIRMKCIRPP